MSNYRERLEAMATVELEKQLQRRNVREGHKGAIRAELRSRSAGATDEGTMELFNTVRDFSTSLEMTKR